MQPALIFLLIRKDLRANRGLFAAYFALAVLCALSVFIWPPALDGPTAWLGTLNPSLQETLRSVLSMYIISQLVSSDPPASDTAFLATRPVSRSSVFAAKSVLIVGTGALLPAFLKAALHVLVGFQLLDAVKNGAVSALWTAFMVFFFWLGFSGNRSPNGPKGHDVLSGGVLFYIFAILVRAQEWIYGEVYLVFKFLREINHAPQPLDLLLLSGVGMSASAGGVWLQYVRPSRVRSAVLCLSVFMLPLYLPAVIPKSRSWAGSSDHSTEPRPPKTGKASTGVEVNVKSLTRGEGGD